jgi:anti-sigma factor RsiW
MAIHCSEIDPLVQSYLDDELTERDGRDLCDHVARCGACRERVGREERFCGAVRAHLAPPSAPDHLREHVREALVREERAIARAHRQAQLSWALPGAATVAAAVALVVFASDRLAPANDSGAPVAHEAATKVIGSSPVMVSGTRHEISQSLHDYIRVRPPQFTQEGVNLLGWRPSLLRGREAAKLVYEVTHATRQRHTMWLHILEASNLDLQSQDRRDIGDQTIWVDRPLGLSSVTYRDSYGIGYVFISDMPEEALVNLVLGSDVAYRLEERIRLRQATGGP